MGGNLTQKMAIATGADDFGEIFFYKSNKLQTPICQYCHKPVLLAVKYRKNLQLPHGIDHKCTIYKSHNMPLGVTCGCYVKLHRQVTHIINSMRERGTLDASRS